MLLELLRKPGGGFRIAREKNDTGNGPVEPMRHTEVDISQLGVFGSKVVLDPCFERWQAGRSALGQERRRLGDREAMVILEQDGGLHSNSLAGRTLSSAVPRDRGEMSITFFRSLSRIGTRWPAGPRAAGGHPHP